MIHNASILPNIQDKQGEKEKRYSGTFFKHKHHHADPHWCGMIRLLTIVKSITERNWHVHCFSKIWHVHRSQVQHVFCLKTNSQLIKEYIKSSQCYYNETETWCLRECWKRHHDTSDKWECTYCCSVDTKWLIFCLKQKS